MNTPACELTIAIPAKNESRLLPKLLNSLWRQDYPKMCHTKVFLADAGSTDGTREIALGYSDRLNIEVIPGGLPSVTTNIWCNNGTLRDHFLYTCNNIVQYGSTGVMPFATGMFMLFESAEFARLGGFHERALYAEDYLLTKRVRNWKFGIVRGRVFTSNRRFRNMGYFKVGRLFIKTAFNTFNEDYFLRDNGYWEVQLR